MQHNPPSSNIPKPKRSFNWPLWLPTPGNVIFTLLVAGLLIMSQNVWSAPTLENTPSSSATTINYQGRLADSSGNALSGSYNLQFAIYDAATGGNRIWGAENHVDVSASNGLFSVGLGSQTEGGVPATAWNGDRYLEISVNGEILTPRELIRGVPIAGMALTVQEKAVEKPIVKTEVHRVKAKLPTTMHLNGTPQIIPGTQITLTADATDLNYLIDITADFIAVNAVSIAQLYIDGVPSEQGQAIFKSEFRGRGTVSQTYLIPVSAGTAKKVDLRATLFAKVSEDNEFTAQITSHTSMTYIAVPE